MIRQPDFVTDEVYKKVLIKLKQKHPEYDYSKVYYKVLEEGKCVQIMHVGPYDNEYTSINKMHEFIEENDYEIDITDKRHHHEIYLGDPRKANPDNLKTVIRLPIK